MVFADVVAECDPIPGLELHLARDVRRVRDGQVATIGGFTAVTDGNQKACAIGLWVEPVANPGPRTVRAGR